MSNIQNVNPTIAHHLDNFVKADEKTSLKIQKVVAKESGREKNNFLNKLTHQVWNVFKKAIFIGTDRQHAIKDIKSCLLENMKKEHKIKIQDKEELKIADKTTTKLAKAILKAYIESNQKIVTPEQYAKKEVEKSENEKLEKLIDKYFQKELGVEPEEPKKEPEPETPDVIEPLPLEAEEAPKIELEHEPDSLPSKPKKLELESPKPGPVKTEEKKAPKQKKGEKAGHTSKSKTKSKHHHHSKKCHHSHKHHAHKKHHVHKKPHEHQPKAQVTEKTEYNQQKSQVKVKPKIVLKINPKYAKQIERIIKNRQQCSLKK